MSNYNSSNIELYNTRIITNGNVVTNIINGDLNKLICKTSIKLEQDLFNQIKMDPTMYCHAFFRIINPNNNNIKYKLWSFTVMGTISEWGRYFWISQEWSRARDAGAWGPGVYCFQPQIILNTVPPNYPGVYKPNDKKTAFAVGEDHYFAVA